MIEIKNARRWFGHGRSRVSAIDNTSFKLDDNGLVALLGPSGCGKTTLLNNLGGLDKLNKGSIYINGKKISSRNQHKVDKIRNINIGYIFQDYKLINTMSVYDNVSIVLKILGIKDKEEIDKRVTYVLDRVGMLRYKRRPCGMLSGGERQRVGIARAIVKDPDIILADEPTGNLDSKNSLEIMKIIKAISKDRLVILVTHEVELAKFYADRILEISDGVIKNDYKNDGINNLDYELDNTFYLKDFKYSENIKNKNYDINIYSNDKDKVKLDIVIFNNNLYIKSNSDDKIEVVDNESNIEFINDKYKEIESSDIDKYKFDFDKIINKNIKKKYKSIFNPVSLIINGFKKVFVYTFLKKILLVGFFLSGMFIMYSVSSIVSTLTIDEDDYITINRDYVSVTSKNITVSDYLSYMEDDNINYIIPGTSLIKFGFKFKNYYQIGDVSYTYNNKASIASIDMIIESDLIEGVMPSNKYEVIVDKDYLDRLLDNDDTKMSGIFSISDFINIDMYVDGSVTYGNYHNSYKIVGIVDKGSPSIYFDSSMLYNVLSNSVSDYVDSYKIVDYDLYKDDITIKEGRNTLNDYEVIVSINNKSNYPLNKECDIKVNNKKLTVVGYFDSKYSYDMVFVNNNTIKYNVIDKMDDISIYSKDKDKTISKFQELGMNVSDSYSKSKNDYMKQKKKSIKNSLLVSGVMLVISLIEIFFMVRSSFLSRVKEVGIYRAIGLKRLDIYKMFFGEIIAISTLACIPGILFMGYVLNVLSEVSYFSCLFTINIYTIIVSIIFIYIFNLVIGLIPVFNTVRKKPANILSRYDLD